MFDLTKLIRKPTPESARQEATEVQEEAHRLLLHLTEDIGLSQAMVARYMRNQKQNVSEMLKRDRPIPVTKLYNACVDLSYDLETKGQALKKKALILQGE